jgi:hypothetical protein
VVVIALSAVLILTGLQWLAVKPKDPVAVEMRGDQVAFCDAALPAAAATELQW